MIILKKNIQLTRTVEASPAVSGTFSLSWNNNTIQSKFNFFMYLKILVFQSNNFFGLKDSIFLNFQNIIFFKGNESLKINDN